MGGNYPIKKGKNGIAQQCVCVCIQLRSKVVHSQVITKITQYYLNSIEKCACVIGFYFGEI